MTSAKGKHDARDDKSSQHSTVEELVDARIDSRIGRFKLWTQGFGAALALLAIVGITATDLRHYLFEKAYPPDVAYANLKKSLLNDKDLQREVAQDILKLLGDRVDSGYSKTIYVGPGVAAQATQNLLQFYARPNQRVELSIRTQSTRQAHFALIVDNKNPFKTDDAAAANPSFGYDVFGRDITKYLQFAGPSELDPDADKKRRDSFIHTIRVDPVDLAKDAEASFEILVLVRNEAI